MGSVGLLYVGAVLFINGCWLLGWVKGTSNAPMNLFVGILQVVTPTYLIFTANGDAAQILGASGLYLFGFTYLYVAMNQFFGLDGTGLGWFCLFVVVAAIVYSYFNFRDANASGYIFGVLWAEWAFLWLLFWLILSVGQDWLGRFTGAVCGTQGIITGMIPALILLGQDSWWTTTLAWVLAIVAIVLYVIYAIAFLRRTPKTVSA